MARPFSGVLAATTLLAVAGGSFARTNPPAPEVSAESEVSPDRLMESLRALPTKRASWADEANRAGLRHTEEFIVDRLKALGLAPELDPVDAIGAHAHRDPQADGPSHAEMALEHAPWNNIVVNLRGQTHPGDVLVFSAHIDAVADAPGADDDGSGTAALLEMARVLAAHPMQRTVRLIFFNLEEVGLVGSRAYTQRLKPELDAGRERIVGMVSLDGVGYFTDQAGSQKSPLPPIPGFTPPTVGNFLAIGGVLKNRRFSQALAGAMRASAPDLKLVVVDMLPLAPPDLLRSDHAPFLALNVPAVIASDTANFRSPHYHKPSDTVETIDVDRFTLVVRSFCGAAYRLAGPPGAELIELAPARRTTPETDNPPAKPAPAPDR